MKKKSFLFGLGAICLLGSIAFALTNSGWPYASSIWFGLGPKRNIVQFALGAVAAGGNSGFYPGVTNTNPLGSSSLRFSNVYTTLLNVSGAATLSGSTTQTGSLTVTGLTTTNGLLQLTVSTAPRTATAVGLLTISTGTVIYNLTDNGICVATATNQASFVASSAPTTACGH